MSLQNKRVAWNKGIKLSLIPRYSSMGFQKGNKLSDNEKSKSTQFKKGEKSSPETQFKKGRKAWNKKDDRTRLRKNEKKHLDGRYRDWMFAIKSRDNWKCRIADENCLGKLEAHHILSWVEFPELRYELNNGIALCQAHHPRSRAKEKRLSPYFQDLVSVSSH